MTNEEKRQIVAVQRVQMAAMASSIPLCAVLATISGPLAVLVCVMSIAFPFWFRHKRLGALLKGKEAQHISDQGYRDFLHSVAKTLTFADFLRMARDIVICLALGGFALYDANFHEHPWVLVAGAVLFGIGVCLLAYCGYFAFYLLNHHERNK